MTTTTNKGYTQPALGSTGWGSPLNANFSLIDSNLGGTASINVAGSSDVTLNSTQASNLILSLTGLLTGNISVKVPQTGSFYIVENGSTGAYSITVKTSAGGSTGVVVPQGSVWQVYSDGTNVSAANWNDGTQFYGTDSGTASALAATVNIAIASYFTGLSVTIKAANANSANATLSVNSIGAKPVYVASGSSIIAVGSGAWAAGQDVNFVYDASLNSGSGGWQTPGLAASLTNLAYTNVANTFTAVPQTISGVGTGLVVVTTDQTHDAAFIKLTDAGASVGPTLELFRDSASPLAGDQTGAIAFTGNNSSAASTTYSRFLSAILDPTASSEDAQVALQAIIAGTLTSIITAGPGVQIGSPTGGDKGAGTLNAASGFYVNGTALTSVVVQTVHTETGAVATGTTTIPFDDTPPQSTEGDQYMSLSITPKSSSNMLRIDVVWNGSNGGNNDTQTVALFQDSTANALAAVSQYWIQNTSIQNIEFTHWMTAGTTSATTFKVRSGCDYSTTTTFNGVGGARRLGGVMASSITITEYSS